MIHTWKISDHSGRDRLGWGNGRSSHVVRLHWSWSVLLIHIHHCLNLLGRISRLALIAIGGTVSECNLAVLIVRTIKPVLASFFSISIASHIVGIAELIFYLSCGVAEAEVIVKLAIQGCTARRQQNNCQNVSHTTPIGIITQFLSNYFFFDLEGSG